MLKCSVIIAPDGIYSTGESLQDWINNQLQAFNRNGDNIIFYYETTVGGGSEPLLKALVFVSSISEMDV